VLPLREITGINNHLFLISLNINGLNSLIKRHRLIGWICKQDPAFCCRQETHLSDKDRTTSEQKAGKKVFQANSPKKQAGVAILIFNKMEFQPNAIK
jgi:exonuclease III